MITTASSEDPGSVSMYPVVKRRPNKIMGKQFRTSDINMTDLTLRECQHVSVVRT